MSGIIWVLVKVFSFKYYERNVGFFLFLFFLMFGVVESSQILNYHLSLIYGMLNSVLFFAIVLTSWVLYALKVLSFFNSELIKPENTFVFELRRIRVGKRAAIFFVVLLISQIPVWLYAILIVAVSITTGYWFEAIVVPLFLILLLSASAWYMAYKIQRFSRQRKFFIGSFFQWNRPRPFPFFYIVHLFNQLSIPFIVTKIFSLLSIIGFLQLENSLGDIRIPILGLCFGLSAHAVLVFEFRRFEERYMFFLKGLCMPISRRLLSLSMVYAMLLAPEAVLLMVNHVNPLSVLLILLFGVSVLLFSHCRLYIEILIMDKHITATLMLFLISFLLALSKLFWLAILYGLISSYWNLKKNYFHTQSHFV